MKATTSLPYHPIDHTLTTEQVSDLDSMVKNGVSRWHWVHDKDRRYIRDCALSIKDGQITEATASTDHTESEIINGIYAALCKRRERRSIAAKKAAVTRAKRREAKAYELAEQIVAGKKTGPAINCALCGKSLGDPVSIERGIGSDCWQGVMRLATKLGEAAQQAPVVHKTVAPVVQEDVTTMDPHEYVRGIDYLEARLKADRSDLCRRTHITEPAYVKNSMETLRAWSEGRELPPEPRCDKCAFRSNFILILGDSEYLDDESEDNEWDGYLGLKFKREDLDRSYDGAAEMDWDTKWKAGDL